MPTLVHADFILWESNAILLYLAEQFPAAKLLPTETQERARVFQWLLFEQTTFRLPLSFLVRQLRFHRPSGKITKPWNRLGMRSARI